MKDLRIVIPALDEEKGIGEVIDRVRKACPEAEVVVVDDGSGDRTAEVAREKGVEVVSNPTNRGKGGATKVGFTHNLRNGINYLGFIDADNTYPPESFPELYRLCKKEHVEVAVASRFLGRNDGMPWMRRLGNRIFATLLSFYSGRRTTDTSTGLRVFNARFLPTVQQLPDGLDFDTAMTTIALFEGLRYAEIPIEYHDRTGESKLSNLKDGYRFLRVIMNAARQHRPALFYLTLGIPFMFVEVILRMYTHLRWEPRSDSQASE